MDSSNQARDHQPPSDGQADNPPQSVATAQEAELPSSAPEVEASEPDSAPAPPSADPVAQQGELEVAAEQDELEAAQSEAARFRDQLLRTAADFDNFRKRSRRDVADAARRGAEDTLREMLPVFDNLERAGQHAESATDVKSLADGIAMVLRQFADLLHKLGVERVSGVGAPFDPAVHEAIQHVESAEHAPGTIAHEVLPGYMMGQRLIRPATVIVAKGGERSRDTEAKAEHNDEGPTDPPN